MKHLVIMIDELYPNRHFMLYEKYYKDEVFNICKEYYLYIEDVDTKTFNNFQQLEDYIHALYDQKYDGKNWNRIKG